MHQCQKRPTIEAKETYRGKRDLLTLTLGEPKRRELKSHIELFGVYTQLRQRGTDPLKRRRNTCKHGWEVHAFAAVISVSQAQQPAAGTALTEKKKK
jgi:hypothetical protein